jgi:hypothetical protein
VSDLIKGTKLVPDVDTPCSYQLSFYIKKLEFVRFYSSEGAYS